MKQKTNTIRSKSECSAPISIHQIIRELDNRRKRKNASFLTAFFRTSEWAGTKCRPTTMSRICSGSVLTLKCTCIYVILKLAQYLNYECVNGPPRARFCKKKIKLFTNSSIILCTKYDVITFFDTEMSLVNYIISSFEVGGLTFKQIILLNLLK